MTVSLTAEVTAVGVLAEVSRVAMVMGAARVAVMTAAVARYKEAAEMAMEAAEVVMEAVEMAMAGAEMMGLVDGRSADAECDGSGGDGDGRGGQGRIHCKACKESGVGERIRVGAAQARALDGEAVACGAKPIRQPQRLRGTPWSCAAVPA